MSSIEQRLSCLEAKAREANQDRCSSATTAILLSELDEDLRQGWEQLDWQKATMLPELTSAQTNRLLRQLLDELKQRDKR